MAAEKKGHVKISMDLEINEALMEMLKESMENMPQMIQMITEQRKKRE